MSSHQTPSLDACDEKETQRRTVEYQEVQKFQERGIAGREGRQLPRYCSLETSADSAISSNTYTVQHNVDIIMGCIYRTTPDFCTTQVNIIQQRTNTNLSHSTPSALISRNKCFHINYMKLQVMHIVHAYYLVQSMINKIRSMYHCVRLVFIVSYQLQ